jgi:hypothetical protein
MSRRFSILLLLLLLVNISGFYGYFIVRLNQLHEESREALKYLPDSELDHFVLSPQEFEKARVNEREVLISGKMYDIARVNTGSEMIEVFALHDEAEDDLLAFIEEVMSNAGKDGKAPSVFSQFSSLIFLKSGFRWDTSSVATSVIHNSRFIFKNISSEHNTLTPPPRSV